MRPKFRRRPKTVRFGPSPSALIKSGASAVGTWEFVRDSMRAAMVPMRRSLYSVRHLPFARPLSVRFRPPLFAGWLPANYELGRFPWPVSRGISKPQGCIPFARCPGACFGSPCWHHFPSSLGESTWPCQQRKSLLMPFPYPRHSCGSVTLFCSGRSQRFNGQATTCRLIGGAILWLSSARLGLVNGPGYNGVPGSASACSSA